MHLTRVEDVLRELERQREPMRQAAERALVYRELHRQLAQLEREYLLYEYRLLRQRARLAHAERNALHEQIVQTELAIAAQEAHADTYGREIAQLGKRDGHSAHRAAEPTDCRGASAGRTESAQ
jgi:chromosome segregation ATPase